MRKFFANMTIRASLLWVLAFFSFMLVIGAALGVLSLRISNGTLAELKQSQELDDALGRVVLSYKDALNGLSRAASSITRTSCATSARRPCRRRAWLAKPPACCSGRRPP